MKKKKKKKPHKKQNEKKGFVEVCVQQYANKSPIITEHCTVYQNTMWTKA